MKHRWVKTKNGDLANWWEGYHNGPICAECGYQPCEHCKPDCFDEECPGRSGFKVYIEDPIWKERLLGIMWRYKTLHIGFWFITVCFSFRGLFAYCADVEEDDDDD